jgi:hypothetical protein
MDKSKYIEYAMGISAGRGYLVHINDKTKAQLKVFATSIGLSVSTSLSKADMLTAIIESEEYRIHCASEGHKRQNEFLKEYSAKYPDGYNV